MRQTDSTTRGSDPEGTGPGLDHVESALLWGRKTLLPSATAALDAQILLAHVLDTSRASVLAHTGRPLTRVQQSRYTDVILKRSQGVPVAYLRGWIEWHALEFEVTEDVLVPRPETELLLERALEIAANRKPRVVVDVGTGSGVLAVCLARALPDARVYGTDISKAALAVAGRNAARHGVAGCMTLLHGDLLKPMPEAAGLVVANLPYLSDEMMQSLSSDVRHEPGVALHAGTTGLELIERLLDQMDMRGWRVPLLLEIDPRESTAITALLADAGRLDIRPDYAGHDRVVSLLPEA